MNIAVTGSSGLIGAALCHALEHDGHRVVRVVRRPIGSNDPVIEWSPATGEIDVAAVEREHLDGVVHLAGEGIGDKRWSDHQKRVVIESRTEGTGLLARTLAALDEKPTVLLSGSAIGYYGDTGDRVVDETSPRGDLFLSDICHAWETAAQPAVDAGITTAFLRTGIVLDGHGGAMSRFLPLFRLGLGGRLGSGRQWMSWITIDDEIRAIQFLLAHPHAGPVNLVTPNPVTNAEFTRALGRAVHRPTLLPIPSFGPKLLLGAELATELSLVGQRVQPTVLEQEGFAFESTDLDVALHQVLG
jgi:uncharacterized protein (TIGR01777 family)